jgi:hypothetical protein
MALLKQKQHEPLLLDHIEAITAECEAWLNARVAKDAKENPGVHPGTIKLSYTNRFHGNVVATVRNLLEKEQA